MTEQQFPGDFDSTSSSFFVYLYRALLDSHDREFAGQLQKVRESQTARQPHLRRQLEKYGVDFQKEVFPLVRNTLIPFLNIWALRKAGTNVSQLANTLLKRYRLAYSMITGPTAPFPEPIKAELRKHWADLEKEKGEIAKIVDDLARGKLPAEGRSRLPPVTKEFHKYRTWRLFDLSLSRILENKGITARQRHLLIVLCLETYLPEGFTAKNKNDALRLRIGRPTKEKRPALPLPRK
jgi:hypothetical protein